MGTTRLALAALALAGVVATGCGSSSNNGGGPDSSTDSPVSNHDGHTADGKAVDGKTGNPDSPINNPDSPNNGDASEGGTCVFETYVVNVIYKAAAGSTPNTNLGQMCTDNHTTIPVASL